MRWKKIEELTDEELHSGNIIRIYHPNYVDLDFNPQGIIEGYCQEGHDGPETDEWIGAVWNNDQDCWETQTVVTPTHYIVLEKPDV